MSDTARVLSIDTIKDFRAALCRFGEDTKNALGAVDMQIRRTTDWLLHDRPMYWQMEIKRRKEELSEANAELFRRKLQAGHGREVHDSEQKEAVRMAQRRLVEAEEKLETVKKWAPAFQHAVAEYLSRARPTGDMIESDLKVALEILDRMTSALDAYIAMAPPPTASVDEASNAAAGEPAGTAPQAASMAKPLPEKEAEQPASKPALPTEGDNAPSETAKTQ